MRGGTQSWVQITHIHDAGGAGEEGHSPGFRSLIFMMLEEQVKRDTVLGLANATSGTTAWLAKKKGIYKVIFF